MQGALPGLLLSAVVLCGCGQCGAGGEFCHGWVDAAGRWHEGFQCPEDYDTSAATTCCGSCPLRYCCSSPEARLDQGVCTNHRDQPTHNLSAQPIYVPFLIVGSIFVAFIILGSLVAVYCCTCLKPKQPNPPPMQYSMRNHQTETIPMIPTFANIRTPSRQSSTATSSSSTGGSLHRFSIGRAEPGHSCLIPSPPPAYSSPLQPGQALHLSQSQRFLLPQQYFTYTLQPEPYPNTVKAFNDFSHSRLQPQSTATHNSDQVIYSNAGL